MCRDLWGPLGAYGNLWGPIGAYRGLWGPIGIYGDIWGPIGTYGDLSGPMGTYGGLWGPIGPYGDLWGPMGTFGDPLAPMENSCVHPSLDLRRCHFPPRPIGPQPCLPSCYQAERNGCHSKQHPSVRFKDQWSTIPV